MPRTNRSRTGGSFIRIFLLANKKLYLRRTETIFTLLWGNDTTCSGAAVAGLLLWEILNAGVVNLPAANWLQLLGSPVVETPVRQFFHKVHLDLLDLQEFLPLVFEQDVEFFMEVADFQLGF